MTLPIHKRASYNPCEQEPCPCGTLTFETVLKGRSKHSPKRQVIQPLADIIVTAHDPRVLVICSTRARRQVVKVIDPLWTLVGIENCPDGCLGIKVKGAKHFSFSLKRKAHLTLVPKQVSKKPEKPPETGHDQT